MTVAVASVGNSGKVQAWELTVDIPHNRMEIIVQGQKTRKLVAHYLPEVDAWCRAHHKEALTLEDCITALIGTWESNSAIQKFLKSAVAQLKAPSP